MIGRIKKFVGFCFSCAKFSFQVVWFLFPYLLVIGCILAFIYLINTSEVSLSSYQKIDKLKSEITDERWQQALREKLSDKKLNHIEVSELESLAYDIEKESAVAKLNGN